MAKLVYAHHTLGKLIGATNGLSIIEHAPYRYVTLSTDSLQDANMAHVDHEIKLDLLDVVSRARFLGLGNVDILNLVTAILSENGAGH